MWQLEDGPQRIERFVEWWFEKWSCGFVSVDLLQWLRSEADQLHSANSPKNLNEADSLPEPVPSSSPERKSLITLILHAYQAGSGLPSHSRYYTYRFDPEALARGSCQLLLAKRTGVHGFLRQLQLASERK